MKGQAEIVDHVFTVLLGVILMIIVVAIVYNFYNASIASDVKDGLTLVALQTSDKITELYRFSKGSGFAPANGSGIRISSIDMGLPSQVSKRDYEVILVSSVQWEVPNFTAGYEQEETGGPSVLARSVQEPVISVEVSVPNMDVVLQGKISDGRNSTLSYNRYNIGGRIFDSVLLGSKDAFSSAAPIA